MSLAGVVDVPALCLLSGCPCMGLYLIEMHHNAHGWFGSRECAPRQAAPSHGLGCFVLCVFVHIYTWCLQYYSFTVRGFCVGLRFDVSARSVLPLCALLACGGMGVLPGVPLLFVPLAPLSCSSSPRCSLAGGLRALLAACGWRKRVSSFLLLFLSSLLLGSAWHAARCLDTLRIVHGALGAQFRVSDRHILSFNCLDRRFRSDAVLPSSV